MTEDARGNWFLNDINELLCSSEGYDPDDYEAMGVYLGEVHLMDAEDLDAIHDLCHELKVASLTDASAEPTSPLSLNQAQEILDKYESQGRIFLYD